MRYYVGRAFLFLWTHEEKILSRSSDFFVFVFLLLILLLLFYFFLKEVRDAEGTIAASSSFSVSRDLFEIIIQPEVFYKCMRNATWSLHRALLIYLSA